MDIQLSFYTITSFLMFITSGVFGIVVYFRMKEGSLKNAFGLLSLSGAGWSFFYFLWQITRTEWIALMDVKLLMAFATFIPISYLYLSVALLGKEKEYRKLLAIAFAAGFIFLILDLYTPLVVSNLRPTLFHSAWPKAGSIFSIYLLVWFLEAFYSSFILARGLQKVKDKELNNQIRYTLIGIILAFIGGSTNYFMWYGINIPPVGNIIGPVWVLLVGYAIIKYNLFNIKIIITEIGLYLLNIAIVIDLVFAKTLSEILIRGTFLLTSISLSFLTISSVKKEVAQREDMAKLADQLKEANRKLEELDKMKTEFISVASHELLTPISAIEGYLSMILDEKLVKVEDPKALQYMDSIYKSAKRLARLVTDLLNVSRIEEGRLLVQKAEINALDLINQVIAELKFKAEDAKIQIETDFPPDVNVNIYADSDKIKEVIINVTGNAIKYTPEGGKIKIGYFTLPSSEVEKRFEIMEKNIQEHNQGPVDESLQKAVDQRLRQIVGENQFVIYVKDSGIGLKHDDLSRLFKKFSRVGEWSTWQVQGTGLGLYISKALIEMHHGRIWAESEGENKGSEFFFSLPLLVDKNKVEEIDKQVPQAENAKPLAKTKEDGR